MHTSGPWHAIVWGHENRFIQILRGAWDIGKDGAIADNRYSAMPWEEELDNARLMQAAPDMLDVLKLVRSHMAALPLNPDRTVHIEDVMIMLEECGPKLNKIVHDAEHGELMDHASNRPYRVGEQYA